MMDDTNEMIDEIKKVAIVGNGNQGLGRMPIVGNQPPIVMNKYQIRFKQALQGFVQGLVGAITPEEPATPRSIGRFPGCSNGTGAYFKQNRRKELKLSRRRKMKASAR